MKILNEGYTVSIVVKKIVVPSLLVISAAGMYLYLFWGEILIGSVFGILMLGLLCAVPSIIETESE